MSPRPATQADTDLAKTWLTLQGWQPVANWQVSDECYVVPGLAACWFFTTNSGLCWLEYLVANPLADKAERRQALTDLVEYVGNLAKSRGFRAMCTQTNHPGAMRVYDETGFIRADTGITHFIKGL